MSHHDLLPVLRGELAGDQLFVVHKALTGDEAQGQLLPAHFQREEDHVFPGFFPRLQQDVQGHGGLAHAGTGGQQNQVRLVQAGDGPVQVGQAGGQAGDGRIAGGQLLQAGVHVQQHLGDGGEPLGGPALANGVDPLFRRLQHVLAGLGALLDEDGELARRLRHPAQQGLVLEDADVLFDIGRGGGGVHELEQIASGGVLVVHPVLLHVLQHRHRVDGEGVVEHGVDGLIELVDDLGHAPGVDEHGAQHRLLRLHRVGQLLEQQLLVFQSQRNHPPFFSEIGVRR